MEKGAEDISQDIKAIVQTREAIADKLGAIEQHVGTTMQHARMKMTQLADQTTFSVRETMQATKEAFDPRVHAERRPWVFVGGALILGYTIGALYRHGWRITTGVVPYYPPGARSAAVMPASGSPPSSERHESGIYPFYPDLETATGRNTQDHSDRPTVWRELERTLREELDVVRNDFIRFSRSLLREMVRRAVPALVQIVSSGYRHDRDSRSNN
jgi:ElaB/YqjD/DUF883 family membrane-anchored ribosome-binding protein